MRPRFAFSPHRPVCLAFALLSASSASFLLCSPPFFSQHIVQLHEELNAAAATGDLSKSNWQSTSLKPSIEYFKAFVTNLMNANRTENPRSYAKQAANHAVQEVGQLQPARTARAAQQQQQHRTAAERELWLWLECNAPH